MKHVTRKTAIWLALAIGINLAATAPASAHCDSLDGPVISEARQALASGDVTPLLKWVPAEDEDYIKTIFAKTRQVHRQGGDAAAFADHYLFSALVKVHRAAEGAPFTGIKPAGNIDPAVMAADRALSDGEIDALIERITARFEQQVRERFVAARQARAHADDSVAQGREFVERYVDYVHYVEGAHTAINAAGGHAHGAESANVEHAH